MVTYIYLLFIIRQPGFTLLVILSPMRVRPTPKNCTSIKLKIVTSIFIENV